jgi:hypothetical protein
MIPLTFAATADASPDGAGVVTVCELLDVFVVRVFVVRVLVVWVLVVDCDVVVVLVDRWVGTVPAPVTAKAETAGTETTGVSASTMDARRMPFRTVSSFSRRRADDIFALLASESFPREQGSLTLKNDP